MAKAKSKTEDINTLNMSKLAELKEIAKNVVAIKGRVPKKTMEEMILLLCQDRNLAPRELAEILNRDAISLTTKN